jgi:hypothetical protein
MLLHPVTSFYFIFVIRTPSANSMELQLCAIWYLVSFSLIVVLSPLISPLMKDPPVPHMHVIHEYRYIVDSIAGLINKLEIC